jgi:hypothetical protein
LTNFKFKGNVEKNTFKMEKQTKVINLQLGSREVTLFLPLAENLSLYHVGSFEKLQQVWLNKDWFGLSVDYIGLDTQLIENPLEMKTDIHWNVVCFQSEMYAGHYWPDRTALFACWYTYEFGGVSGILDKFDPRCTVSKNYSM